MYPLSSPRVDLEKRAAEIGMNLTNLNFESPIIGDWNKTRASLKLDFFFFLILELIEEEFHLCLPRLLDLVHHVIGLSGPD